VLDKLFQRLIERNAHLKVTSVHESPPKVLRITFGDAPGFPAQPGAVNHRAQSQIELRFHSDLAGHAGPVGGRSLTQRALVRGWRPGALQSWAAASCILAAIPT
jgi:hypothetical protein